MNFSFLSFKYCPSFISLNLQWNEFPHLAQQAPLWQTCTPSCNSEDTPITQCDVKVKGKIVSLLLLMARTGEDYEE
jgi:hypothetical protein